MRLNFKRFLSLSWVFGFARNSRILDCGCVMGHLIMELKSLGFTRVHGLDASPEMVQAAKSITGTEIILADAAEMAAHLTAAEVVKKYMGRRAIEVFFKEAKQRLGLGQEQGRSFAAQVFSVTQAFFR